MLRSLSILALVMSLADPAHAQGEPPKVDLTVPMSVQAVYREYVVLPFYNCGTAIYATWPDILGDGDPSDYTLLAAPGQTFKPGLSSFTSPTPNFEIEVPDGFFLHNSGLGGGSQASGMFSPNCHVQAGRVADIAASLDWYAAYKLPDGTPVAFFEWEQGAGRSIRFDAAFDKSFEADEDASENKQPVAAYAWDFGTEDGDTGSGPMPTFTYPEPGAYTVTLRVTDDDGDVDEFTTVVEVQSGLLVYTEVAPQVASPKDTVEVTIWLKNESQEEIQNVRVGSYAVRFEDEYPDGLDPARLTPQDTPVQTEPPAPFVIPVLVPGAEDVVTLSYAVGSEALYSDPDDGEIPIETTWTSHAADVSGTMASGGAAEVRQRWDTEPCGADPCPNVFVVEPSTFTVGITSASGPRVWTGLQPSLDIDEVRFVRYETIADGTLPVCESGCADFILSVRDEDGVAADGVEVNVTIEQDDGVPIDTAPGGFVCERVVLGKAGTCVNAGQTLTVETDEDGRARVWIALQANLTRVDLPNGRDPKVRVEARVVSQPASTETLSLPVDPTAILYLPEHSVSDASAIFAGLTHSVSTAAGFVSVGAWCESFVNWVRDATFDAVGLTRYQRNVLLVAGATQSSAWLCDRAVSETMGGAIGEIDAVVGATEKIVDIFQFIWFTQEYEIDDDVNLIDLVAPLPPPLVAWFQGDALELADNIAGYAFTQGFTSQNQEILIQEVSGLSRPSGATSESDFDPSGFDGLLRVLWRSGPTRGDEVEALVSAGYTPVQTGLISVGTGGFLVGKERVSLPNARTRAASADGPRLGAVAEVASEGETSLIVGAWSGDVGEYLVVGSGTDTPEVVQVRTVTPDGDQTALALTTPLRYDHAPEEVVERIVEGTVRAPEPPILRPHPPFGPPTELAWVAMPTDLASTYDLEVVTDTTATSEVVSASGLTADALAVDPNLFEMNVEHFWRVRSTNEVGVGPWSSWSAFTATAGVSTEPDAEPIAAVELSAPYPNPSSASVRVPYAVPEAGPVRLGVYDALGRGVAVLVDGPQPAGRHEAELSAGSLPAGVYLVRLEAGGAMQTQRLTVVR